MKRYADLLTPDVARAARALTRVSTEVIGEAAAVDPARVRDFEHRGVSLDADSNHRLRAALEEYGVVFIAEDDDGGYGVRRKYSSSRIRQLQNWEAEGGPAFEDDS
ncbi:hypothetical protein [Nesterenkonia sphaerica]|uniref:Uncharacterized protein n=1 Tax=Nesterenkonia sphaerica TaxID=1804988 RepID=A0A5R9A3S9_9MICC|nr:hypothetical protein [Nesterenkonia sphaerica]TLP73302.1 hypothetical protein FEF27_10385 [Nesterenkonia sphaerica]